MKRTIAILLFIAALTFMLASCGGDNNGKNSKLSEFQKFREEFLASDVYKTAHKFVSDIIETGFKTKEYDVAIEPKSLSTKKYDQFTDLKENEATRIDFFNEYALTITMSCIDEGIDVEAVLQKLIDGKLTGELYDPRASMSYNYTFSATTGKFEKVMIPGV